MGSRPEPLNDRVGEFIFSSVLYGKMEKPPQVYLEVKDKDGNPVKIELKKKEKKWRNPRGKNTQMIGLSKTQ